MSKKEYHFHLNLKNLICGIISGLILLYCLGSVCHAETTSTFYSIWRYDLDKYGFVWKYDDYLNSSIFTYEGYGFSNGDYDNLDVQVKDLDLSLVENVSSYSNFAFIVGTRNSFSNLVLYDDNCKLISSTDCCAISGTGNVCWITLYQDSNDKYYINDVSDISYEIAPFKISSSQGWRFCFGNSDVYMCRQSVNNLDTLLSLAEDQFFNVNYLIYNNEGQLDYDNPISGGGSSEGGEPENYLYLDSPDFIFNIPKYTFTPPVYGQGSIIFNANINDYQRDHLNDFNINIMYTLMYDVDATLYNPNDELTQRNFNIYKGIVITSESLDQFYNQGSSLSYNISDIFEQLDFYELSEINNYVSVDFNKWQIKCQAWITTNDDVASGNYTEVYNFLTKESVTTDSSLRYNNNPYIEDGSNGSGDNYFPDNDTVSSGGNQLINNDNDSIVIESNGEVAERVIDKLIPEDGNGGLSEELQESFNNNGWLELCKSVMPMLPETFWDKFGLYAIACLGIASAAFVLRLILDLL